MRLPAGRTPDTSTACHVAPVADCAAVGRSQAQGERGRSAMSKSRGDPSAWPPELALPVEDVCNRFEAAWRAGARPRIEAYLDDTPEPGRSVLLGELLALELEYRRRSADLPTPAEYDARFPGHTELVRDVFARALTDDPQVSDSEAAGGPGASRPCATGTYEPADTGTGASGEAIPGRDLPGPVAGRRSRFTALKQHAQGGLGTVSLAFDETL